MRSAITVTFSTEIDYSAPRNEALMRLIFGAAMAARVVFCRSGPELTEAAQQNSGDWGSILRLRGRSGLDGWLYIPPPRRDEAQYKRG